MREYEIRKKAISDALKNGDYAVDPYGFGAGFIWDWQQDCYIDLQTGEAVEIVDKFPLCAMCHIEDFITNRDEVLRDGYELDIESIHIYRDQYVLAICCSDGVVLNHRAWRDIDWHKCGF